MKSILALCFLFVIASGDRDAKITNQQFNLEDDHKYSVDVKTSNDIKMQEKGISLPGETPNTGSYLRYGKYSYRTPDGTKFTVFWQADENGFRARGDHLPDYSNNRNAQLGPRGYDQIVEYFGED